MNVAVVKTALAAIARDEDERATLPAIADQHEPKLYAVQDGYGGTTLAIVTATSPLEALDGYCDLEVIARYSSSLEGAVTLEECEGLVYRRADNGLAGAVFSNYEIVAVPIVEPVRQTGVGQAGFGVVDAVGTVIVDGCRSQEHAGATYARALGYRPGARVRDAAGAESTVCSQPTVGANGRTVFAVKTDEGAVRFGYGDELELVEPFAGALLYADEVKS